MPALREKAEILRKLHAGPRILVLTNAWDAASARVIQAAGFPAVATSSAGIAYVLGYPDGQRISRAEMLDMVRRIAASVDVPVSADVEAGYGTTADAAAETARGVVAAGAAGMNLEDVDDRGELLPVDRQVERLRAVRAAADALGVPLVVNARTDTFGVPSLAPSDAPDEAVRRANAYLAAGADCAFVPFVRDRDAIARLARDVAGPLNVLGLPGAPPVAELEKLGVRRVTVGSGVARAAYGLARRIALELRDAGTYGALGEGALSYAEMQALMS
ncbi:isocitrate lyase/PEP mutase family protein [Anaeromyxobacter oryzae]|uniref:2-methylisocitrate lyase n=1 Tax=Anaeromyxobacter oryzae TaxID=2918170 RepID=A0ABN6N0X1_9BACT|nr:isocitrate lyase/phosphoenolpyruvate mutase family protein [Anaeromyxobacter oryzae]BDG05503.1 2-methylisocitrate lyase [Anaeromyxobacter oryzae]